MQNHPTHSQYLSQSHSPVAGCATFDEYIRQNGSDDVRGQRKVTYSTVEKIVKRKAREQALRTITLTGRRFDKVRKTIQYFDAERTFVRFDKEAYGSMLKSYFSDVTSTNIHDALYGYLETGAFKSKLERLYVQKQLRTYGAKLAHSFDVSNLSFAQYARYYGITSGDQVDHYSLVTFFKKVKQYATRRNIKRAARAKKLTALWLNNRFAFLPVEECEEVKLTPEEEEEVVRNRAPWYVPRYHIDDVSIDELELLRQEFAQLDASVRRTYRTCVERVRDSELLFRLRQAIRRLRAIRTGRMDEYIEMQYIPPNAFSISDSPNDSDVQCEMMDDSTPIVQQQEAGPVVLNALQNDEMTVPITPVSDAFWINNSTSDVTVDLSHSSNMEILAHKFVWDSNDQFNMNLFNVDLPGDVISRNMNHPAAMMFAQYAYWNGDIKVRIHINTTPFHIGMLVFSWYYAEKFDANASHRNNVASAIQLPHVFYNASEGNDVVMDIPFRNYRSMLCTRKKADDSLPMYLGTLRCHVMNPLTLDKRTTVDGFIHVSFNNNNFTGIIPRSRVVQPEMMPTKSLIKTVEGGLHIIDKCLNMDKPSNPVVPLMQTPQFSDSFASGVNDISNVHMLRLDPAGQTQHPLGSSTRELETSTKFISRQWGYLSSVTLSTNMEQGKLLYTLPVSPELDYNNYFSVDVKVGEVTSTAYVLPPVSVLASINAYNRGSLEYKFQIINSKYHTGALVASFTPVLRNVTLADALQSYYTTLDIGNVREYTFKVPYINERPYNPRFNRADAVELDPILAPIGELNLFVFNQLRNITGASDHVYINIYLRAGDDFEVAVPVGPLYSVLYDSKETNNDVFIYMNLTSKTIGLDNWRYATQAPNLAIIKNGVGADNILAFSGIKPFCIYERAYADESCKISEPFTVSQYAYPAGNIQPVTNSLEYVCMYITNNDGNKYSYGITFTNLTDAQNYVKAWLTKKTKTNSYPNSPTISEWLRAVPLGTKGYLLAKTGSYRELVGKIEAFRWKLISDSSNDIPFEIVQAEVNDVVSDPTVSTLASTMNGFRLFGEQFKDLKDYCRRYQPYGRFIIGLDNTSLSCMARIPLFPIGLRTDSGNSDLIKLTREGMTPFIASAYRFYRGSLRFKLVFTEITNNTATGEVFYIQHKPDIIPQHRDISVNYLHEDSSLSLLLQSGYAYTAASTTVNNAITVEVPCYCPTNLLLLQSPDFARKAETLHYSLGVLDIYMTPSNVKSIKHYVQIHSALADDMDFSCFIGFPPMVPMYKSRKIQAEMADDKPTTSKDVKTPEKESKKKPEKESQGPVQWMKKKVHNYVYSEARKDLELPAAETKNDSLTTIIKDLIIKVGKEHAHVIYSSLSQIVHCINNPSIPTFTIAFITICMHAGYIFFDKIQEFGSWIGTIFTGEKKDSADNKKQPEMADDNKTETSSIDSAKDSIIYLFVKKSAEIMGIVWDGICSVPKFLSRGFFQGLRDVSSGINQFITLVKNMFSVIPAMFNWLGKVFRPKQWLRWYLYKESDLIKRWVSDVEFLTDPCNISKVRTNRKYFYHAEMLVIVGRDLVAKTEKVSACDFSYIKILKKRLDETFSDLATRHTGAGSIGIEPWCMCIHGDSQVGKTFVTKQLTAACLKAINFETSDEVFYTRSSSKHWDGLDNQPVCILDDFGHVLESQTVSAAIDDFLLLKSKATFTPPQANLSDKGKKYAPLIVAMTMNSPFERFTNVVATCVAWQSRRDVLIKAEYCPPAGHENKPMKELPQDILDSFAHMRFKIHMYNHVLDDSSRMPGSDRTTKMKKVAVPNEEGEIIETETLTYKQLEWYLIQQFKERYQWMKVQYAKDFKLHMDFLPDSDEQFDKNLQTYVDHLKHVNKIFNAREEKTIAIVSSKRKCSHCNQDSMNCGCDLALFHTKNIGTLNPSVPQPEMGDTVIEISSVDEFYSIMWSRFGTDDVSELYRDYERHSNGFVVRKDLALFFNHFCFHTYVTAGLVESYILDNFDGVFKALFRNKLHNVEIGSCSCAAYIDHTKYLRCMLLAQANRSEIDYPVAKPKEKLNRDLESGVKEYYDKKKAVFINAINTEIPKKSWLGEKAESVTNVIKRFAPIMLVLAGVVGVGVGIKYAVNKVQNSHTVELQKTINQSRAQQLLTHEPSDECLNGCVICTPEMAYDQNKILSQKAKQIVVPKTVVSAQMATEFRNSLVAKLQRNTFFLVAITSEMSIVASRCLGIQDRCFIGIDHYFDKFKSLPMDTQLYYKHSSVEMKLNLNEIKMQKLGDSSIIVCQLPSRISAFANIVNKFAPAKMIPNMTPEASLVVLDHENTMRKIGDYTVTWHREQIKFHDDTLFIPHIITDAAPYTSIGSYWSYKTSGKGLCGSVLVSTMNTTSPIVGVHVAGDKQGGRGYSELICRETLENALESFDLRVNDIELEGQMFDGTKIVLNTDVRKATAVVDGFVGFVGVVPNKFAFKPSPNSKCVHSMCYNQITQSTYDVPHLSPKDIRFEGSPMVKGCNHHGNPVIPFETNKLDIVAKHVEELVLAKVKPLRNVIQPLTVEEAIQGIPDIVGYDAMEFDTSEGFPFLSIRPKGEHDKRWLFDMEITNSGYQINKIDQRLLDVMQYKHEQRINKIVPMTVFTDCLKDLKLPKEKCGNTRIFSVSPVDFTIQFRQYFYDFTIAFQAARFNVESAVGINVDSYEWNEMVTILMENSTSFVCGDYSKFGPRLMAECVQRFFDIIINWYKVNGDDSEENATVRYIMGQEIAFSKHLMFNFVYEVYCGAPSGCPITTILNNGVNMMYLRYAYLHLSRERNLSNFRDDIAVMFYGDDLIMTVKPEIVGWFNANSLSEFFGKYDIKFTDALKTNTFVNFVSVFDGATSFLKRNIRRHPFRPVYVGAMDKRAIEETCNWVYKDHPEPEASIVACESMLLNAFGHGPEYYNTLREKCMQFWREHGVVPRIPLWNEVDTRIYDEN